MKGRTVLLTGASSGIGLATARLLAQAGCRLFLAGRSRSRLEATAGSLGAALIEADVADTAQVQALARSVEEQAGRLDALINCAGQLEVGPAADLGLEATERLMRVNFLGAAAMIHCCLPLLRRGREPVIVNVASIAGRMAPPYMAAYAASKFALCGYSHSLRQELRREGIHVGLVLPGPVDTPMVHGKIGGDFYPVPPGVPVVDAGRVARAILSVMRTRRAEVIVPRRLAGSARLASAYPRLVDALYAALPSPHSEKAPPAGRRPPS